MVFRRIGDRAVERRQSFDLLERVPNALTRAVRILDGGFGDQPDVESERIVVDRIAAEPILEFGIELGSDAADLGAEGAELDRDNQAVGDVGAANSSKNGFATTDWPMISGMVRPSCLICLNVRIAARPEAPS